MVQARQNGLLLAAAVFLADQLAKSWIVNSVGLRIRGTVPIAPFLNLTWVENHGISMGILNSGDTNRWLITALTAAIAVAVAYWLARERDARDSLALGAILGGALGNIADRVRLGYVVDFVHLHLGERSFYVFNVADAAITLGVIALLLKGAVKPKAPRSA